MKNKWQILLMSFISIILICAVGCNSKQYTKEEIYEKFQNQISKISSYTCTMTVEAIGNKENTTYIFTSTYEKPDYYKLEVKSPENLKGQIIEYKGNKSKVYNPNINDTVEFENIKKCESFLFIGDFIKSCMGNENVSLQTYGDETKIEVEIPGEDEYFNKQILYINNDTKNPTKMDIINKEGNTIFIVTYEDFNYKK